MAHAYRIKEEEWMIKSWETEEELEEMLATNAKLWVTGDTVSFGERGQMSISVS